ncbi:hypothetical protein OF83DRAFT_1161620 [Amylostereum chailletii]|nr:hypothetical protein OF83DRAFT_1161620 [Amylostereum chailletii]
MPPPRRRVSYSIPPPADHVPRFHLPPPGATRLGSVNPLLVPVHDNDPAPLPSPTLSRSSNHPRHRLGVASLALDTSTQLVGHGSPEGILYSGGRDGLVIAWDLGIPMKPLKRSTSTLSAPISSTRWEYMTGWGDDIIEEEMEEEDILSDGDILGDVKGSARRRRPSVSSNGAISYEGQWLTDLDAFRPGSSSRFRQSTQVHTDWVNDILLCNNNQTLMSASSDGSVKAWNPHEALVTDPTLVGMHADYARCLAKPREHNWVASGSFDRTIKLWDLGNVSASGSALLTLNPPDSTGPKASIYALAVDPLGHTILLTASADASIKLWSLASQRCLHTFTHHTDSVWSLHSTHPSLQIFYSGDKSGFVCKVDVEGCTDMSEGECVVVCQDTGDQGVSDGINQIVAMDDNLLWTASGSSSLKRWRVPQPRSVRAASLAHNTDVNPSRSGSPDSLSPAPLPSPTIYDRRTSRSLSRVRAVTVDVPSTPPSVRIPRHSYSVGTTAPVDTGVGNPNSEGTTTWYGIPYESLVRLASPDDPLFSSTFRAREADVSTLYSAASVLSVPHPFAQPQPSPMQSIFPPAAAATSHTIPRTGSPVQSEFIGHAREDTIVPVRTARAEFERREVVADAIPLESTPDEVISGGHGLVRAVVLNDRIHSLTVDTAGEVAIWDIVRGVCVGRILASDIAAADYGGGSSTASGNSGGPEHSPREALEIVRERIEGEAVVLPWSTVGTKMGVLTVHLNERCFEAELYADEAGCTLDRQRPDDQRVNLGKWALRNLFQGFIREEQRIYSRRVRGLDRPLIVTNGSPIRRLSSGSTSPASPTRSTIFTSPTLVQAIKPRTPPPSRLQPPIATKFAINQPLSPIVQSPSVAMDDSTTPVPRHVKSQTDGMAAPTNGSAHKEHDYFTVRAHRPLSSASGEPDDFSGWGGPGSAKPDGGGGTPLLAPATPNTGGFMGRLKTLGKSKKSHSDVTPTQRSTHANGTGAAATTSEASDAAAANEALTPVQSLLAGQITPPTAADGPTLALRHDIVLIIAEEHPAGWSNIYRGTVASAAEDVQALEETMPMWLLEYLLLAKAPAVPITKVGFVLLPYQSKEPGEEQLPELLNTSQSKLTASRFLRVRKLTAHVQDKLDKLSGGISAVNSPRTSPRTSIDTHSVTSVKPREDRPRPEETWEILCHDTLLPLDMTLAVVRQFIWKQGGELVMHYRRKRTLPPSPPPLPPLPPAYPGKTAGS